MATFIEYNGIKTWTRKSKYIKNSLTICPVCKKEFNKGDDIYLLINNNTLFHNCCVHKECYNEDNPTTTIKFLKNDFEQAEKDLERIKCWFDYYKVLNDACTEITRRY